MKASTEKKLELAKDILLAYIANSPTDSRDVDTVVAAAKKIFDMVDSTVETTEPSKEQAGFKL